MEPNHRLTVIKTTKTRYINTDNSFSNKANFENKSTTDLIDNNFKSPDRNYSFETTKSNHSNNKDSDKTESMTFQNYDEYQSKEELLKAIATVNKIPNIKNESQKLLPVINENIDEEFSPKTLNTQ